MTTTRHHPSSTYISTSLQGTKVPGGVPITSIPESSTLVRKRGVTSEKFVAVMIEKEPVWQVPLMDTANWMHKQCRSAAADIPMSTQSRSALPYY